MVPMTCLARKMVLVSMLLSSVNAYATPPRPATKLRIECLRPPTPTPRLTMMALRTVVRLLRVTDLDDPSRASVYFSLARHWRGRADALVRRLNPCNELLANGANLSTRQPLPALARHELRRHRLAELRYLLSIATHPSFARFQRLDEVLFRAAALFSKLQRPHFADRFFQRLFTNHPRSRFITEAYLALAEDDLRRADTAMASAHYEQAAKLGGPVLRGYALFMRGWCWLRRGDAYRALELFVTLLRDVRQYAVSPRAVKLLELSTKRAVVHAVAQLAPSPDLDRFLSRLSKTPRRRGPSSQDL